MRRHSTIAAAALAGFAVAAAGCTPPRATGPAAPRPELFDYVASHRAAYEWRERARYERGATEIVELRLHSQVWRGTLWKHRLFMIRPERIATGDNAVLVIAGGRWSEADEAAEAPRGLPEDADVFIETAEAMETVVAVLGTVPFQPLLGLTEDYLIARTFDGYLHEADPDWPLLLPMTASAVRAMDAVQAASQDLWGRRIEAFTVTGGSKRGWTTWLTAAVDERVAAIAPLVFDALDMAEHFPHQTAVWGRPSEKIRPYTDLNLDDVLSSDEGRTLRRIVDPYAYRSRLTLPKLVVNATNDEYFPVDSANLYWEGLENPKYLVYAPNQPHGIEDVELVVPSINALHRAVSGGAPLPELAWEYESGDGGLTLCIRSEPAPAEVAYWRADSADRDFRDAQWTPTPAERRGATHVVELARPETGYAAIHAALTFDHGAAPYLLSTAIGIVGAAGTEPVTPPPADQGRACEAARAAASPRG